ncbi:MAG: tRNA (guanosine(46)-N7)-methyltransferase TrmB [Clostridia bacterium]|nr:tRNA (guanosine(46)-N7)-methyltransferase TrmB [Clostridia bacterium]
MRMRKKKHAAERLEACSELILPLAPHEEDYRKAAENTAYYDIAEIFGNSNPLHLEIGCGKGQFICELARRNPDINYVAIEVCDDVAVLACEGIKNAGLQNVRFMVTGAEYLLKYFPDSSVERVYLNFSCPFPKARYAKHRLTSPIFLPMYRQILKSGGEIHQKTDNMHFFEYSIEQYSKLGFTLQNISLDLHGSDFEGNIITEYEKRFTELGQPIYRLEAVNRK